MIELGSTSRHARGASTGKTLGVAAAYVVLTLALTYPLSVHPASTTFPGSSDRNLYIWTLAWDAHALLHQPLSIFDANIFHPYRWTLAYSENLIGAALVVAPVAWLLQNPVLTMNLTALASVPLCALGAFLLARRLGLGVTASWICGLVYGFAPPRFLRIDQAHLTAVEWIPFSLAFAHAYATGGRPYDLRLALAFLSLQALTSGHGTVFLLCAFAVWGVYAVVTGTRPSVVTCLRDAGWPGALLVLPMLVVFIPYWQVQVDVGLRRDLGDWTGSWTSFLSSPTHVDAWLLNHLGPLGATVNTNAQAYLFPGVLPVLLAAAAFLGVPNRPMRASWQRAAITAVTVLLDLAIAGTVLVGAYALTTGATRIELASVIISLRSWWRPWGIVAMLVALRAAVGRWTPLGFRTLMAALGRWCAARRGDVRLLYLLLIVVCVLLAVGPPYGPWRFVYWMPGLSFIRVPSRFMILAMLGVGVLCGFGFERLMATRSVRVRRVAAVVVSAALCVEFAVVPFDVVANPIDIPAADRWLDRQAKPFVVAEVPPMDPTIPMLHSMAHWQKTVHGYSGWNPSLTQEITRGLGAFPDDHSLALLQRVGVTFVVVHGAMYSTTEWQEVQARLARYDDALSLRFSSGTDRVYQLNASKDVEIVD
jgi:hypothetical protein